ncbi:Soluble lytic murein transglycosylase precursor [Imhoffiella purpurea]|uniref:Soluble lytic murein transglycosylase n=1 Tax=Imhoffiella purpurea TaxID=1249627 RepID=W9VC47_9GAMM|nr:Soluble lytic murein transglycosylase precursor [Imhoffiella purpurea]
MAGVSILVAGAVLADPRQDFLAAESALKRGDRGEFARLSETLKEYPLYPYLRFAELTRDLGQAPDADVESFLNDYPDTQLEQRLRLAYLARLAEAGRWRDYARIYRPGDSMARRCLYLRALIETGRLAETRGDLDRVWGFAGSRPSECDPLFAAWRDAGWLTTDRIRHRLNLTMEAGNTGLVRYLSRMLPETDRDWPRQWLELDANPERLLDADWTPAADGHGVSVLAHGIVRLNAVSTGKAMRAIERWRGKLDTDPARARAAYVAVGRALAERGDRLGLLYWDRLVETPSNQAGQALRLRSAVALGAWDWVAKWVSRMPESQAKRDRWLYWKARADERLGLTEMAREGYREAARERSLWGFLAADRIGASYNLAHRPTPAEPERIRRIVLSFTYRRLVELHRLGRETDLRREWRVFTRGMEPADLMAAAFVADVRGWHDQAIFTLARTGYWDDLELRFPLRYRERILDESWQIGIQPDWVFAILRQESVFARTVASPVGAVGLMQLMPETAREVAASLDLEAPSRWDLVDPALNIVLGSSYLASMRDRFGHPALATAAYNAGPHRVMRWLPRHCTDADVWILGIPFAETRGYVERVLTYRVIYAARLGAEGLRASDLLPPVPDESLWRDQTGGRQASSR